MPMYVIERTFAEQLDMSGDDVELLEEINADEGVSWLFSFLSADRHRTYCLYEAPSPDAIIAAAKRAGIPADAVTEVITDHRRLVSLTPETPVARRIASRCDDNLAIGDTSSVTRGEANGGPSPAGRRNKPPCLLRVVLERDTEPDAVAEHAAVLDRQILAHDLRDAKLAHTFGGRLDGRASRVLPGLAADTDDLRHPVDAVCHGNLLSVGG